MPSTLFLSSSSSSSDGSSPSNFYKTTGAVVVSNRIAQFRKHSTPTVHFDSIATPKLNDNFDYAYDRKKPIKRNIYTSTHTSRRRNSSSVAPPMPRQLLKPNMISVMPSSNSVHTSLYSAVTNGGYSLDRNNNSITDKNYRRRESRINDDETISLPYTSYDQQSLSLSPSSVSSNKYTPTSSESSTTVATTNNQEAPAKGYMNEKIIACSDCVIKLPNRPAFYRLYEIGGIIGQGNFSDVYAVYSESSGHKYAVKEINKSHMYGKLYFVENEIAILKKCTHQNICKLVEAYECENFYFLLFEYAQKGDLFETVKRMGRLNERYAAQIIYQVSSALSYLHKHRIVHRDVKPENILLGAPLCAKLTDFGLACGVAGPLYRVCGTPTYVAPEILTQEGYGVEVDLWSLGVLLYVMLIGFAPFRCSDRAQLFRLIVKAKVSFDMPTWSKISHKAKQLILKMLTPTANNRIRALEVLDNDWIRLYSEKT